MKTEKEMWDFIHEPKVVKIVPIFDEHGKPIAIAEELDRILICWREDEDGENKK
jgi:hypothetical protein